MIQHAGPSGTLYYELEQGDIILEKREVKELSQFLSREFIPHDLVHAKTAVRRIVHLANVMERDLGSNHAENHTRSK